MADLVLTAMTTPSNQVTYCTRAGVPYRGDDSNVVYAPPSDTAELTAQGFATATATQVPAGDQLALDVGWAVVS